MRIYSRRPKIFTHTPFEGQGVSLYVDGRYRNLRVIPDRPFLRQGTEFPVGDATIPKTARIDSTTGTAGQEVTLTPSLSTHNGSTIEVDLRHYKDNVECESVHPVKVTIDVSGNIENKIRGAYSLINVEVRSGGIVRIRFFYAQAATGIQPETMVISRTAGPTSPSDVSEDYVGGGVYEIDTPALSDSSAYTYAIKAVNTALSVTRTLGTVSFTADATGPAAATSVTAEAF